MTDRAPAHLAHAAAYYARLAFLSSCRGRVRSQVKMEKLATRDFVASGFTPAEAQHAIAWA